MKRPGRHIATARCNGSSNGETGVSLSFAKNIHFPYRFDPCFLFGSRRWSNLASITLLLLRLSILRPFYVPRALFIYPIQQACIYHFPSNFVFYLTSIFDCCSGSASLAFISFSFSFFSLHFLRKLPKTKEIYYVTNILHLDRYRFQLHTHGLYIEIVRRTSMKG